MGFISATKDIEGYSGLTAVKGEDILFLAIESRAGVIILHTLNSIYYTTGTLKYWTKVLNASGYCFMLADRNNSINISNIVEINKLLKVAYFEPAGVRTRTSKFSTMSKSGLNEVLHLMAHLDKSVIVN
ncbi:LytTR family transcriptional regulator DNA-binding domain-containing protein [Paenibacillus sp. IHBB 3054]|uniref:LytTR family transcriptional regulator DNA-binding domain-containing protein n=1 Tax=Paenibacillus sp. IHBB 3054 TaxID=3425689 RepID=UPI003F66E3DC